MAYATYDCTYDLKTSVYTYDLKTRRSLDMAYNVAMYISMPVERRR